MQAGMAMPWQSFFPQTESIPAHSCLAWDFFYFLYHEGSCGISFGWPWRRWWLRVTFSHFSVGSEGGGEVDCQVEAGKLIEADEYIRWLSWNFSWPSTYSKGYLKLWQWPNIFYLLSITYLEPFNLLIHVYNPCPMCFQCHYWILNQASRILIHFCKNCRKLLQGHW